jgi:hypothetical protein
MSESWPSIVESFRRDLGKAVGDEPFRGALGGISAVAEHVERGELRSSLFGWRSMFDLCIQQTDVQPGSGSYLRISPLQSGKIEFRYLDTAIKDRQWHRQVTPNEAVRRFEKFLEQLRWVGAVSKT